MSADPRPAEPQTGPLGAARKALLSRLLASAGLATAETRPAGTIAAGQRAAEQPLSWAQRRLWFMQKLAPRSPFYNVPVTLPLHGPLDVRALRLAVEEIVGRHDTLRTVFVEAGREPLQRVLAPAALAMPLDDLSALAPAERDSAARAAASREAREPFDLARGPVIRARLLRLAPQEHRLLLTLHHIACDGWSMQVLLRELASAYAAAARGQPPALPPLPIQYADFAAWQREHFSGERLEQQLAYWRDTLSGVPQLGLVADHPRPADPRFEGDYVALALDAAGLAPLKRLASEEGATLFMVLLAAYAAMLHRYTGDEDIAIGAPIANRTRPELELLIGFFVNTLVFRIDLSGQPSFRELLRRVRRTALDAYTHQDLPFEKLVEALHPEREPNRNPLFQVGFVLQNAWNIDAGAALPVQSSVVAIERGTSIFDLAFHLHEHAGGLAGGCEYSTELFERSSAEGFVRHFVALLRSAGADPQQTIGRLALFDDAERARLLPAARGAAVAFDEAPFIVQFERHAAAAPRRPAIVGQFDYGPLDAEAGRLAGVLHAAGVRPGALVLLLLERSAAAVVSMLALWKAGATFVPLDTELPAARLRFIAEDTAARFVVTSRAQWAAHRASFAADCEALCVDDLRGSSAPPPLAHAHDAPAYVIYTSGSTGQPKGVVIGQRGLSNVLAAQRRLIGVDAESRVLQFASLAFDAAVFELGLALGAGGALVIPAPDERLPGPALARLIDDRQVTHAVLPPSALFGFDGAPLASLHTLMVAGEACPAALVERWAPGRRFLNLYGPTETTIWATWEDCRNGAGTPTIGQPIDNLSAFVLDPHGTPVPAGIPGELCIAGVGLAQGYLNRPALDLECFVSIELAPGRRERLYRTGDRVRLCADGRLAFVGRIDRQVKLHGHRIELGEIEAALQAHPQVAEAAVTLAAAPDARLLAYVVQRDPGDGDAPAERAAAAEQVEHWHGIYDQTYASIGAGDAADPAFVITGWNSSYTGQPLAAETMRAWLQGSLARLHSLAPRRVLEIGCGSGLIALRLAAEAERYVATDFAQPALDHVAAQAARLGLDRLECRHQAAHEAVAASGAQHDLVVLNSVVQYFPSERYLLDVLRGAVATLASPGTVFIGDVRSLALLDGFATSVELYRAESDLPLGVLRERVARRIALEQELVIDPDLFLALAGELPGVQAVELLAKTGAADNELARYRYDVMLHVGWAPDTVADSVDWDSLGDEAALLRALGSRGGAPLRVAGIPGRTLAAELATVARIAEATADSSVGELRAVAAGAHGLDAPELIAIAERAGCAVELHVSGRHAAGRVDAVFRAADGARGRGPLPPRLLGRAHAARRRWTNSPLDAAFARAVVPRLRAYLEQRLPAYMVPARYTLLPEMPRTASGKIDRARLPAAERGRPELGIEYVAPFSAAERRLAAVWSEVLRIEQVGAHDNFFELGGDSILSIQVVSRARAAGLVIEPKDIFAHKTLARLARAARAVEPEAAPPDADAADGFARHVDASDLQRLMARFGNDGGSPA